MLPRRSPRRDSLTDARPSWRSTLALLAPLVLPLAAAAHAGPDAGAHHGFVDGLLHPFSGLDHLAAMLAVGLWSALDGRRAWLAPLAFLSLLSVGAVLASAGVALPGVEPMIAASLLVVGLLLAMRGDPHPRAAAAIAGGFAVFHGAAHGTELSSGAALAGMLLGTLALLAAGVAAGLVLRRRSAWWTRAAGGAVAGLGALLMWQLA